MTEVNIEFEPHDSEIAKIGEVIAYLRDRYREGRKVFLDDFPREAKERFHQAGFQVRVNMYDSNVPGVVVPEIVIEDRIEGEFDPDRQVWEVTHDVLDIGEGGVIQSPLKNPRK